MRKPVIFISYRRDDCPGYAGRLEEALERALGAGAVFRDVRDIAIGSDFAAVIESCLRSAQATLVLVGPRWAGLRSDGGRRIDEAQDFVRLEVAQALAAQRKVIPVLLSGVAMPQPAELPEELRSLSQKQALRLDEDNWDADVQRLIDTIDLPSKKRRDLVLAGASAAALGATAFVAWRAMQVAQPAQPDATVRLLGTWQALVRYAWGDSAEEQFVFERFAGKLTGTATFLKYPRGMEQVVASGDDVEFVTHSIESMNGQQRELTHRYTAELRGDRLRMRMHTTGGFTSQSPLEFEAASISKP
jgi:hypothetical protein